MNNKLVVFAGVLAVYIIIINLATFYIYGLDKRYAKTNRRAKVKKNRIPEKVLIALAGAGGGVGAYAAMKVYRHKTKKMKFTVIVPMSIVAWCLILLFVLARL